jgi:hypothetical protein
MMPCFSKGWRNGGSHRRAIRQEYLQNTRHWFPRRRKGQSPNQSKVLRVKKKHALSGLLLNKLGKSGMSHFASEDIADFAWSGDGKHPDGFSRAHQPQCAADFKLSLDRAAAHRFTLAVESFSFLS